MTDKGHDISDMFSRVRARMPEKHRHAGETLDRVNAVWVDNARDKALRGVFDRFLTYVTAAQRNGRYGKGNALFVTGESGAGKSDIVENLLLNHEALAPMEINDNLVTPWVSLSLPRAAPLRVLGTSILKAIDYGVKDTMSESTAWELLPDQIKKAKVFLIHIDETQHLLNNASDAEKVAGAIKGLMNYRPWPVSFILSGMPETNNLIVHDNQAERRNFSFALPAVDPENHRHVIVDIIEKLCAAGGFTCAALTQTDMPERISHAASDQFGRICEVTIRGIQIADLAGDTELKREHFAKAYRDSSHTRGHDDLNPFYVENWKELEKGYFVTQVDEE